MYFKRTGVIEENEDFFNYRQAVQDQQFLNMFRLLNEGLNGQFGAVGVEFIEFYGEIFGGAYPHAEVPQIDEMMPVQGKIDEIFPI
jgi:hypothetical protein